MDETTELSKEFFHKLFGTESVPKIDIATYKLLKVHWIISSVDAMLYVEEREGAPEWIGKIRKFIKISTDQLK